MVSHQSGLSSLLAAFEATAFALLLQYFAFVPLFGLDDTTALLLLAVVLATWMGGLTAGVVATALCALLQIVPHVAAGDDPAASASIVARVALFIVCGGLASALLSYSRTARHGADERQRDLEQELAQLRAPAKWSGAPAGN